MAISFQIMAYLNSFFENLETIYDSKTREVFRLYFESLCYNYLEESSVPTIVYMNMLENDDVFNQILMVLVKNDIVISNITLNYATSTLSENFVKKVTGILDNKLLNIQKLEHKLDKYMMKYCKPKHSNLSKVVNSIKDIGINREGFMRAGGFSFKYTTKHIKKYAKYIAKNIYKALQPTEKDIKYEDVVSLLLNYYGEEEDKKYSLGTCISDSRGRAIFDCTHKIFNPVSSKDARACLLSSYVVYDVTSTEVKHVYAYISELLGYRGKNWQDKVNYGQNMYIMRILPSLEEMIEKNDFDDLHARIWLERIYENLDHIDEGWSVPIELDATASMLQMEAVLLNSHELMDNTNLINPNEFKDAWTIPGVPRNHVKKAVTPMLYGSSKEPKDLWEKHKFKYTQDQINLITEEIRNGRYSLSNTLKKFIIDSVHPNETMEVHIFNEKFTIKCNRFVNEVKDPEHHFVYVNAYGGSIAECTIQTERTPDLKQFKRYFVTLLLHNLDSQVANSICKDEFIKWILPNHDAFIVNIDAVDQVRKDYTNAMYNIYTHRDVILSNYFNSIGIEFHAVKTGEEIDKFSGYCLK